MKKLLFTFFATLCLLSPVILMVLFPTVQIVEASGTIYIMPNGLVEGTDKITNENNITYTFTDNINDNIIVFRSNIVIDGNGYTLNGSGVASVEGLFVEYENNVTIQNLNVIGFSEGVKLQNSHNNSVCRNNLTDNDNGISLEESSNNIISGNTIPNNGQGIYLNSSSNNSISQNYITIYAISIYVYASSNNTIYGNTITNGMGGIELYASSNNTITGNNITEHTTSIPFHGSSGNVISGNTIQNSDYCGIWLSNSSNNKFYHNNFIDNAQQVRIMTSGYANFYDNGFEGNYWDNYTGADLNHDGIGDTLHVIDVNNKDYYPLMGPFHSFITSASERVSVVSNSRVTYFNYEESKGWITIQVRNATTQQSFGFCRISIPHSLIDPEATWINVFIDDGTVTPLFFNNTLFDNGTHRWIYVAYPHSMREIVIVPEFPVLVILPLFLTATLLTALAYKRRRILKP